MQYYCKKFADTLPDRFLKEYEQGTLLIPGRKFKWANLNGIYDIQIISFDGIYVRFNVIDEGTSHTWTIDNFFIFDDEHLKKLFDEATVYKYDINSPAKEGLWGVDGIYIFHDESKGCEKEYYVGQSKDINRRLHEHSYKSSDSVIARKIRETNNFTVRFIKLENSGYRSLDALERAFITYLESYKDLNGYNQTRGNNIPQIAISTNIREKLTTI